MIAGSIATAINILVAPREAFSSLNTKPSWLFPLALLMLGTVAVMGWYFSILDFDWYIDDTLGRLPNLEGAQLDQARERMQAFGSRGMAGTGIAGGAISLLAIFILQAAYLSFVSALRGDSYRFRHWFSLTTWTNIPYLLVLVSMAVNILLHPSGQLSVYDLNALSLANLGMQTNDAATDQLLASLNLAMFWSLALMLVGYRQWLGCNLLNATAIVIAPYLVIFGAWAYFVLS